MKASSNELRSLLKQAFEGCGLDQGAYESAADIVLWSQASGLAGFDLLENAIQGYLQNTRSQMTIQADGAQNYRIDAAGESILMCGALLSDLASTKALESEFCVCEVSNVSDPILLAKLLVDTHRQGLFGFASWGNDNQVHMIKCTAQECVDYLLYPAGHNTKDAPRDLVLIYARDKQKLEQYQHDHWPQCDESVICHSAKQVKLHQQNALSEGLDISNSLWQTLNHVAKNVLVESTEQSRMGAGA